MENLDIFTIWLTDKDWGAMPYLYEVCIASWQVMNPNRKVTIYTNHDLHLSLLDRKITNVCKIQAHFPGLYEKAAELTDNKAHQSDYIRYTILSKQQGIYFDTDVLCYRDVNDIVRHLMDSDKSVMLPMEDGNMICNAFLIKAKNLGTEVFEDIIDNYDHRYIKHSYLFNSQKYLMLMARRHSDKIMLYDEDKTIFKPSWLLPDNEFDQMVKDAQWNDYELLGFKGIGFHLYTSVKKWDDFREYLDNNLYNKEPDVFITRLTKHIIDQYILLMKEEDTNGKSN